MRFTTVTVAAGLLAVLFSLVSRAAAETPERPPNIVLIVSDDQGYHDLGCYGNEAIRTPHLDKLAAQGVRCTDFYVTWPACTPSRGSLLTGRYPQRNGLYDMIRNDLADTGHEYGPYEYAVSPERVLGMDTREIMISDVLSEAGYTCGVFGKWDGGQLKRYLPLQRGFDDFYGFVNTGIDYFTHERYGIHSMYRDNEPTTEDKGTYATYLFRREAVRFIDENAERPFFLYVPFNAPHGASNLDPKIRGSVQAPQKYKDLYPDLQDDAGYREGSRYGEPAMVPNRAKRELGYKAAVTCMDDCIGDILAKLDEHALTDDTLVVFFSDNGGSGIANNHPLRGRKAMMFEGGLRVPCIARFPGRLPEGTVCREFLTSLELFPTFTRVAGAELPADVVYDGFDLLPVLAGDKESQREEMYWQRRGDKAARVGNWKWVDSRRGGGLFNLAEDIGEEHDLSEERPEMLETLKVRFAAWKERMQEAEPRGPFRNY